MAYSQVTLGQFVAEISASLGDPGNVWWPVAQVSAAVKESLLLWGGFSSYWRERGVFQTSPRVPFYDLSHYLPNLRARTVTLGEVVTDIQWSLLEPGNGISGTGMTSMFTVQQIIGAVARARNEFVLDARLPARAGVTALTWDQATGTWDDATFTWDEAGIGNNLPIMVPPPEGRVQLPDEVALVARAAWRDALSGIWRPLRREDPWSAFGVLGDWNLNPTLPIAYSTAETRPVELQLIPGPLASGTLDLVWIPTISMDLGNAASLLEIPDEFAPAVKYRALWELLSQEGPGADPWRAKYSLERYKMIVQASGMMRSVLNVLVNNRLVRLDTLDALDAGNYLWENLPGTPRLGATVYDLLALSPVPPGIAGITCDVVRSAPIPASAGDYLQLGKEELPYLADYCRHVLSFNLGGGEFQSTLEAHDNFLKGASQRGGILGDKTRYLAPLFGQASKEAFVVQPA